MIARDTIDRIFQEARIEEVVADFVQLKKAGSSYKGLSPFAQEKTPSFFVSPSKGIFKDFSSGKGGNAVTFLMELESMSYPEALRYLANKYGIEIEETGADLPPGEEVSLRESLALVNHFAFEYFTRNLWEIAEGKQIGLSYFRERQFTDATIKTFGLGYAMDENDAFLKAARDAGYKEEHLTRLGLIKEGNYGLYDFFRGRVIFPIRNVSGRTIAFAGRTLKSDNKVKYLNSPESELYEKSKVLYGLYEGKRAILQKDLCFLVEGYTDVISLHQAGVEYAVASSGTSLTEEQIKLIKRYTKNVSVLYDGDNAGVKAAMRGIDMLLKEGMQVRVVLFPDGHDPDSYARSVTQDELEAYLDGQAKDFIDFFLEILLPEGTDKDPIQKTQAMRRMVESLALIADPISRSVYVEKCSRLMSIAAPIIHTEINKILRQLNRKEALDRERSQDDPLTPLIQITSKQQEPGLSDFSTLSRDIKEKELVRVLLQYGNVKFPKDITTDDAETAHEAAPDAEETEEVGLYILAELINDEISLSSPILQRIIDQFTSYFESNGSFPHIDNFSKDVELSKVVADVIGSPHELSENWADKHRIFTELEADNPQKMAEKVVCTYKLVLVNTAMGLVDEKLKDSVEEAEMLSLLTEKMKLKKIQNQLCKVLEIVTPATLN